MSARYIVMVSSAQMPSSCWGRYVRVAVVELEPGFEGRPKMISPRAKGVRRIVKEWGPCFSGTSDRDQHSKAIREAEALIAKLASQTEWQPNANT